MRIRRNRQRVLHPQTGPVRDCNNCGRKEQLMFGNRAQATLHAKWQDKKNERVRDVVLCTDSFGGVHISK